MFIQAQGMVLSITPSNKKDTQKIQNALPALIEAGYGVEKRTWGGWVITDPTIKFEWEMREVITDVKKVIGFVE